MILSFIGCMLIVSILVKSMKNWLNAAYDIVRVDR